MRETLKIFLSFEMLKRAKTVFAAIIFAAAVQFVICQPAFSEYSERFELVLLVTAVAGWILLGFNAPNGLMAFCGSVAVFVPYISYSMLGYGLLEMGGFLHALCGGGCGLICYYLIRHSKTRKQQPTPPVCNSGS